MTFYRQISSQTKNHSPIQMNQSIAYFLTKDTRSHDESHNENRRKVKESYGIQYGYIWEKSVFDV